MKIVHLYRETTMPLLSTYLYSLKEDQTGKISLSIDLGKFIENDIGDAIQLILPQGPATIPKGLYLNKDKIWDNGKCFFFVCSKQVNRQYIFQKLLQYRLTKFETYISYFEAKRNEYKKELNSLKLKAA